MISYVSSLLNAKLLQPEVLWLAGIIAPIILFSFLRKTRSLLVSGIRLGICTLLLFALADPVEVKEESTQELAVLLDSSASISPKARASLLSALEPYAENDSELRLLPFAQAPARKLVEVSADELDSSALQSAQEQVNAGDTNIQSALNQIVSLSSSSSVLLLSDGFETQGNALQAAKAAAAQGVRVYPLIPDTASFEKQELRIASLHAPITVDVRKKAIIRTSIENSTDSKKPAVFELWMDEKKLFQKNLTVPAGREKVIVVETPALKGGLKRLRALIRAKDATLSDAQEVHRWISVKEKSKILLISGTRDDQLLLKPLLSESGFGLENVIADGSKKIPTEFQNISSVIINNVAKRQLPKTFLPNLKDFVAGGGGALLIGGDRSFGLGDYIRTPLEEISPLRFVPPQTNKRRLTVAVVLVVDKSGSMAHQGKIQAAKSAAMMSIQTLKDEDYVSVIGFDHAPFVIIDIQKVGEAKRQAERRLRNLTAAGRTNLLPALSAARQKLSTTNASRKHVIVLSDGKVAGSNSDSYVNEVNALRKDGVSISGVALGVEADVPFMKLLARYGRGAFYHTMDPSQLPQIFVNDIKVAAGERTMKEDENFFVGNGPSGIQSTSVKRFPPIRGFVETKRKPKAELELITKRKGKAFPILASWNYKKGRVAAFTSDASARWILPWVRWPQLGTFWSDLLTSIKNRSGEKSGEVDFDLRYYLNRKSVHLDLAIFDKKLGAQFSPKIEAKVTEPGGEFKTITFKPKKKGRFEGIINNGRPGDYNISISYGSLKLPPLAISIPGKAFGEAPGKGVNMQNLEEIAYASGGLINPSPEQLSASARISEENKHLYPPLVLIAFFLILIEALLREIGLGFLLSRARARKDGNKRSAPKGRYHTTRGKKAA